ncbi:hypothetical protein CATMIT_01925, partial [Catenibacterium mitsuokai DSM 15897]
SARAYRPRFPAGVGKPRAPRRRIAATRGRDNVRTIGRARACRGGSASVGGAVRARRARPRRVCRSSKSPAIAKSAPAADARLNQQTDTDQRPQQPQHRAAGRVGIEAVHDLVVAALDRAVGDAQGDEQPRQGQRRGVGQAVDRDHHQGQVKQHRQLEQVAEIVRGPRLG